MVCPFQNIIMGKLKLRSKDFKSIEYNNDICKSLSISILSKYYKHLNKNDQLNLLNDIRENPDNYLDDDRLVNIARLFISDDSETDQKKEIELKENPEHFTVVGRKLISSNAYQQMALAMRLPIAVKGALMPDAHQGYGLPIGGVLATHNAVIPYGVGRI